MFNYTRCMAAASAKAVSAHSASRVIYVATLCFWDARDEGTRPPGRLACLLSSAYRLFRPFLNGMRVRRRALAARTSSRAALLRVRHLRVAHPLNRKMCAAHTIRRANKFFCRAPHQGAYTAVAGSHLLPSATPFGLMNIHAPREPQHIHYNAVYSIRKMCANQPRCISTTTASALLNITIATSTPNLVRWANEKKKHTHTNTRRNTKMATSRVREFAAIRRSKPARRSVWCARAFIIYLPIVCAYLATGRESVGAGRLQDMMRS